MLRWAIRRWADVYVEILDYKGNVLYYTKNNVLYKERLHLGMTEKYQYTSREEATKNLVEKASAALATVQERA